MSNCHFGHMKVMLLLCCATIKTKLSVVIFSGRCEKEAYHDNSIERDEPARFSRYGLLENEDITLGGW